VNNLIQATTPKGSHESDPFWTKAETALLQAIILMLWQEAPEYEQNFSMVMRVLEYAEVKEEDEEYVSPLDLLFQSIEREKPDSVAVRQYKVFKMAAGKTSKSILVSTAVRLAPFNLPQIKAITDRDDMDLYTLGEQKCALYAVIPDNDQSFNFLVSLLYAQAFQALYYSAARLTARNELDKALARLLTAEEKAEQINHSFYLAMIQRLASTCFHDVYVFNKAEEYAIKARQNFDKAHKPNHSLWCELIVADALLSNNKIDSAISVLQNNRNASDYNFEYEWHTTMAEAQFRAINNVEAINNYEWLKANAGSLSSRDYSKLSRCYINTNNLIEAKNNLKKAEEYSRNWKDTVYFRMVASDISKIEGDIHNSFNLYKKAVDTLTTRYDNLLTHPYYNIINQTLNNDRKQYKEQAKVEKKLRLYATALIFLTIIIATTIIMVIRKDNKTKKYRISLLMAQAGELKSELNLLN